MNYFNSFHTEKSLSEIFIHIFKFLRWIWAGPSLKMFLASAWFCAKIAYFDHQEIKIINFLLLLLSFLLLLEQRAFKSFPTLWLWDIFKDPLWRRGKAIKNRLDFLYKQELTFSFLVIHKIKIRLQEKDMLCSKNTLVF